MENTNGRESQVHVVKVDSASKRYVPHAVPLCHAAGRAPHLAQHAAEQVPQLRGHRDVVREPQRLRLHYLRRESQGAGSGLCPPQARASQQAGARLPCGGVRRSATCLFASPAGATAHACDAGHARAGGGQPRAWKSW